MFTDILRCVIRAGRSSHDTTHHDGECTVAVYSVTTVKDLSITYSSTVTGQQSIRTSKNSGCAVSRAADSMRLTQILQLVAAAAPLGFANAAAAISTQAYTWNNVRIGGGGGFVPGIVFNPSEKGLTYLRTDIGGAYKLNPDDSWTPLLDFADNSRWDYWGVDALATDPVDTGNLYLVS